MGNRESRSDEKTFLGIQSNPFVFIPSLFIVFALIATTLIVGEPMSDWFTWIRKSISQTIGWYYILLLNLLLFFALYLGFGKFSNIRIGGNLAKPEFSIKAWFAMLFSASMGIGLLFWSVAEPVSHFNNNPNLMDAASDIEKAKSAMGLTFLHWGFHVWALYAVVALALAYFTFNRNLPLTIRSLFQPLLGDRIHGRRGDIIDIIAVVATLFGLATSLGLGVQQVNSGLEYLFEIENSILVQIILIILITSAATMSLVFGLDKGIKVVSEWNMRFAILLLAFMLLVGPTIFLLKAFIQNIGYYTTVFFLVTVCWDFYSSYL